MEALLEVAKIEGVRGTIIGEILEILEKKDFTPVSNKIESGEELIPDGDMTDLEKAVYTLARRTIESIKAISVVTLEGSRSPQSLMQVLSAAEKMKTKTAELLERHERIMELLWMLIRDRLKNGHSYPSIGIRDGFRVVNIIKDDCNCPICQIRKRMEGVVGASAIESFSLPGEKIHEA